MISQYERYDTSIRHFICASACVSVSVLIADRIVVSIRSYGVHMAARSEYNEQESDIQKTK